jgi:hypothetical protein
MRFPLSLSFFSLPLSSAKPSTVFLASDSSSRISKFTAHFFPPTVKFHWCSEFSAELLVNFMGQEICIYTQVHGMNSSPLTLKQHTAMKQTWCTVCRCLPFTDKGSQEVPGFRLPMSTFGHCLLGSFAFLSFKFFYIGVISWINIPALEFFTLPPGVISTLTKLVSP